VLVGGGCEPPQYVPGIVSYGGFPTAYNDGSDDHQGYRCIYRNESGATITNVEIKAYVICAAAQ